MSDPVTNIEIEDVLSSIRRLVSGEAAKPPRRAETAKPAAVPAAKMPPAPAEQEHVADAPVTDGQVTDEQVHDGEVNDGQVREAHLPDVQPAAPEATPPAAQQNTPVDAGAALAADDDGDLEFDWSHHLPSERLAALAEAALDDGAPDENALQAAPETAGAADPQIAETAVDAASEPTVDMPAETPAETAAEAPAAPTDRLMLTPALRVDTPAARADVQEESATSEGEIPTAQDDSGQDDADVFREDAPFVFDGDATLAAFETAEPAVETEQAPERAEAAGAALPEEATAQSAGEAAAPDTEAVDEAGAPDAAAAHEAADDRVEDGAARDVQGADETDLGDTAFEAGAQTPAAATPIDPVLKARVAALEAAVAGRNDDFEPDGGDEEVSPKSYSLQWEDHVAEQEADILAEAEQTPAAPTAQGASNVEQFFAAEAAEDTDDHSAAQVDEGAHAGSDPVQDDDSFLDEEALREMVSEIVRQELQGALGERITRNVRKLVRREIQRALTSQTLE